MSGMDRMTDELLEAYAAGKWKSYERDNIEMARELLARRASQAAPAEEWEACTCGPCPLHPAAPAPVGFGMYGEYTPITVGAGTTVKTPAPSDGLREAEEECDCCVDGLQADGETPCPYCTKPKVPIADAAEALLEAHKSGAWPVGQGRTLQQVATIIDALHALRRAAPTEGEA